MAAVNKERRCWNKKRSLAAGAITLAACAVSMGMGRYSVSMQEVTGALTGGLLGSADVSDTAFRVVCLVRLPRVLGALVCGGGLAAAGAGFQAVFANPLASPDTIGTGSAASFGAVLAILLGADAAGIQCSALIAGMASAAAVYIFAGAKHEGQTLRLVLAGMVASAFFSALTSFAKYAADPQDELPSITYWLIGSLKSMGWDTFLSGAGWIAAGVIVLVLLRWKLDALMLGGDEAVSLGVPVFGVRTAAVAASSLITASVVSMCGQIGWIGLMIPHLCRILYGGSSRSTVVSSVFYGAVFLLAADTAARCVTASEIPVSIITSMVGAPIFLLLLARTGKTTAREF